MRTSMDYVPSFVSPNVNRLKLEDMLTKATRKYECILVGQQCCGFIVNSIYIITE